jgi:hypothetical protein
VIQEKRKKEQNLLKKLNLTQTKKERQKKVGGVLGTFFFMKIFTTSIAIKDSHHQ